MWNCLLVPAPCAPHQGISGPRAGAVAWLRLQLLHQGAPGDLWGAEGSLAEEMWDQESSLFTSFFQMGGGTQSLCSWDSSAKCGDTGHLLCRAGYGSGGSNSFLARWPLKSSHIGWLMASAWQCGYPHSTQTGPTTLCPVTTCSSAGHSLQLSLCSQGDQGSDGAISHLRHLISTGPTHCA